VRLDSATKLDSLSLSASVRAYRAFGSCDIPRHDRVHFRKSTDGAYFAQTIPFPESDTDRWPSITAAARRASSRVCSGSRLSLTHSLTLLLFLFLLSARDLWPLIRRRSFYREDVRARAHAHAIFSPTRVQTNRVCREERRREAPAVHFPTLRDTVTMFTPRERDAQLSLAVATNVSESPRETTGVGRRRDDAIGGERVESAMRAYVQASENERCERASDAAHGPRTNHHLIDRDRRGRSCH